MSNAKLPLLAQRTDALETCAYCPKLCRAACPVANVEASETVTPWGAMSMAFFSARGDTPLDAEHASVAWACSGCMACRQRCEHDNPVPEVLGDARADYYAAGLAPEAVREVAAGFDGHCRGHQQAVEALAERTGVPVASSSTKNALLVGCSYATHSPDAASASVLVAARLLPDLGLVSQCCGRPLLEAGDRPGIERASERLRSSIDGVDQLVVADPGCARMAMRSIDQPDAPSVRLLLDVIYAEIERVPAATSAGESPVVYRYHDPCHLGRGLGRYEEPRAILARATGAAPGEIGRNREQADCSGGGGLLPITRPASSEQAADVRIAQHREAGGGVLVTACGESLRRFRTRGENAVDIMTLVAEAFDGT